MFDNPRRRPFRLGGLQPSNPPPLTQGRQRTSAQATTFYPIVFEKKLYGNVQGENATSAPIAKGSCQPSKARMTEGWKAVSKTQVRYGKATLSSFRHSAYCILPQSHLTQGRSGACSATDLLNPKNNKNGENNPSVLKGFCPPSHLPWLRGGSMLVYIKLIDGLPTT